MGIVFHAVDSWLQALGIYILILIIALIFAFFRSRKDQKDQINRIEKKIDDLHEQLKKMNNQ